jgi:hypothetical protein
MGRRRKSDLANAMLVNETESNSSSSSHLTMIQRNAANDRERTRMRVLSKAFLKLKTSLPWVPKDTKLSKLDTLKLASIYISYLTCILKEDDSHLIDISEYSSCTSSKFDIKQIIPVFISNFKASSIEKHRSLISNLTESHKSQTPTQNHNNFVSNFIF